MRSAATPTWVLLVVPKGRGSCLVLEVSKDRPRDHHHDKSDAQPGILSGLTDEHGAPVRSDAVTGTTPARWRSDDHQPGTCPFWEQLLWNDLRNDMCRVVCRFRVRPTTGKQGCSTSKDAERARRLPSGLFMAFAGLRWPETGSRSRPGHSRAGGAHRSVWDRISAARSSPEGPSSALRRA